MSNFKGNKKSFRNIIIIIVLFVFVAGGFFYIGNRAASSGFVFGAINDNAYKDLKEIKDAEEFKALFEVREALYQKYDGEIDDKVLVEGAIKGMTSSLGDPYTVFMNQKEFDKFMESSSGSITGIGVQIGVKDNKVTIIAPIEGSPAEKAGIKAGDVLLKVDEHEIGNDSNKAVSYITGKEGTEVNLTLQREGKGEFNITLKREVIKIHAVKGEMLKDNMGYIQIASFDEGVTKDLVLKINELKDSGMKGLILDLRGNPGGYLTEAVGVASQFIPKGKTITYTIDKYDRKVESTSLGGVAEGMPLIVLIDGGSASASEVVTGALRDYEVATTIGTTTFGKGVVQQPIQFKDGLGALKVTISKYYTPNGENIHKKGIAPNIEVKVPKEVLEQPYNRATDVQLNRAIDELKGKL
ncbi:MAG: S41 family peptidase [Clostridium sp.]